jgi:hypothetical protein
MHRAYEPLFLLIHQLSSVRDYVPNAPYFPPQNQTPNFTPQPSNVASLSNNFSQFGFGDVSAYAG